MLLENQLHIGIVQLQMQRPLEVALVRLTTCMLRQCASFQGSSLSMIRAQL